jgi:hypothetical protein
MTKQLFSPNSVINTYIATEDYLYAFLGNVPYCPEHKNVWSPILVTILLESCSQLDSLWQYESRKSPCVTKRRLSINDYFSYYGEYLGDKWLMFYGETTEIIKPYSMWSQASQYIPQQYPKHELEWWKAYNKLKHNRFINRSEAKLQFAINALAGLFLVILRSESCRNAIAQAGWMFGDGHNIQAHLGEDSPSDKDKFITAESKLFTYAVGWGKEILLPGRIDWQGTCSLRFRHWIDQYS